MHKNISPDPGVVAKLEFLSAMAALAVTAAGCIVLGAWAADVSLLHDIIPDHREMKPNVAVAFILAGGALLLMRCSTAGSPARIAAQVCAAAVAVLGAVTLSQYLLGWESSIDQLLYSVQPGAEIARNPGRMAPSSAVNFCLLGAALLLHGQHRRGISLAQLLAMPAALIALMAFAGYLYGAASVRGTTGFLIMARHTALVFLLLCGAICFAHPRRKPMATLASGGSAGIMLRRLFPAVFALLFLAGWIRVAGREAGLFDTWFGAPLAVTVIALGAVAVMWGVARRLERADAARQHAEMQLLELNSDLERRVAARTEQLEAANCELRAEVAGHEDAKAELRANEEIYRFMFDCNPLPLCMIDAETFLFTAVNQAAIDHYGYSREEFLAMSADRIRPEADIDRLQTYYKTVSLGHNSMGVWRHLKKDGTMIDVEVFHHVVSLHGRRKNIVLAIDVTERRKAEQALQDYAERLQLLSRQLLTVQETERSRIARELHDQIGQTLTAVKLRLQSMRRPDEEAGQAARLEDCIQLSAQVLEQVRCLSLDLRPPLLDELGLAAALQSHVNGHAHRAGLFAHFEADPLPVRLSQEVGTACFRVVQEALTNVLRHAQASYVSVELRWRDGWLHLTVADDGAGFDPGVSRRQAMAGNSIGLLSMEERMMLIGGHCDIRSMPGWGTTVHAACPLTKPERYGEAA
jgi:PAS domain S-box-containing protein